MAEMVKPFSILAGCIKTELDLKRTTHLQNVTTIMVSEFADLTAHRLTPILAIEVSSEAYIPCSLALLSLATEDYQKYLKQLFSGVTLDYLQGSVSDLVLLYIGPEWDIFLAIFLIFILAFVIMFRRQWRHYRGLWRLHDHLAFWSSVDMYFLL